MMIISPLGIIRVFADGACLEYQEISHGYDRPPVKEHPIAGCYRIHVTPRLCLVSHGSRTMKVHMMPAHGMQQIQRWTRTDLFY